jgi:hypothetical protein
MRGWSCRCAVRLIRLLHEILAGDIGSPAGLLTLAGLHLVLLAIAAVLVPIGRHAR